MEPSLEELTSGRGALIGRWLRELGICSPSDVRWFWSGIDECLCELETVPLVSREDILHMQTIYEVCCARAELRTEAVAAEVAQSRSAVPKQGVPWRPPVETTPALKRGRMLIPWRSHHQAVKPRVVVTGQKPGSDVARRKLRELFKLVCTCFVCLAELGLRLAGHELGCEMQSLTRGPCYLLSSTMGCLLGVRVTANKGS